MNQLQCCKLCSGGNNLDSRYCENPSCECHMNKCSIGTTGCDKEGIHLNCHQPQDWEKEFTNRFYADYAEWGGHETTENAVTFIKNLLQTEKEKSFEEGKHFTYRAVLDGDAALHHKIGKNAGILQGRNEVLQELLAEWPKKQTNLNPDSGFPYYKDFNKGSVAGFNEALADTRSLVEKKLLK